MEISLETVLTESHPQYSDPLPNEQYCYRNGRICFQNAERITWVKKSMIPNPDLVGPPDYGNIDVFYFSEGSYHLIGEWGELEMSQASRCLNWSNNMKQVTSALSNKSCKALTARLG